MNFFLQVAVEIRSLYSPRYQVRTQHLHTHPGENIALLGVSLPQGSAAFVTIFSLCYNGN